MGFRQVLPFLSLLSAVSASKGSTLQLFPLPNFRVNVIATPFLDPNDQTELINFGNNLKDAVNVHLFDTFKTEFLKIHQIYEGESPESRIDHLEIGTIVDEDPGLTEIRADMSGHVSLKQKSGFEITQSFVSDMVKIAFETAASNENLLILLHEKVDAVTSVQVYLDSRDTSNPLSPPKEIPTVNTVVEEEGTSGGKPVSKPVAISLTVSLITLIVGLFAYVRRDHRIYKKSGLLIHSDEDSDFSEEDGFGRLLGELELDEASYASLEEGDAIQFVPVPAKIDKEHTDKALRALQLRDVQPKRYVKPGSPFELLYGASFSHRDQAKVAKAHGLKYKQPKTIKVSGKKIRKKAPLKPMVSITEGNEDETKAAQPTEAFFPQFMSNLSSLLSNKTATANPNETESLNNATNEKSSSSPLVYRDFPRHDGTPCVLFTKVENVDWSEDSEDDQTVSIMYTPYLTKPYNLSSQL